MLVFTLLVVTSTLCYYLGAIALFFSLVSLLWKVLMVVVLPLALYIDKPNSEKLVAAGHSCRKMVRERGK